MSAGTRLRTNCVLNTEWRICWIVQHDSMVIVWIHRHNYVALICDPCRCCVQALAHELRRKILNSIANEVTVWIRRSNVICVFLCMFVKCIDLVNNIAIHFGLHPILLPMYPLIIFQDANF